MVVRRRVARRRHRRDAAACDGGTARRGGDAVHPALLCAVEGSGRVFGPYRASSLFECRVHFDYGAAAKRLDVDAALAVTLAGAHLYVCGPPPFIDFVLERVTCLAFAGPAET